MRRFFILALMALSELSALAYDFESGGIYYNITSSANLTVEVTYPQTYSVGWYSTEYHCAYSGDIVIPESVIYNGTVYEVTGIGANAFGTSPTSGLEAYMHNLKTIQLPSTIKTIGQCAFYMCDAVKTLIIPASVSTIGNDSFWCRGCEKIIFLSSTPPAINTNGGYISGDNLHIPCEVWVSNINLYNKWNRDRDSFWGGLVEMLTPNSHIFTYSADKPNVLWTNNLTEYTMNLNLPIFQINAGNYTIEINADFYKNGKFQFGVELPYEYTIHKALLVTKANNAERLYGEEDPIFSLAYSGFVKEENESVINNKPTISTTATKTSNVGEYPITISGGEATNYEFVYEPGVLTVTKSPLSAKVDDATKVYGAQNPAFTIEYYGLKNDETAPAWTTSPTFQTEATHSSGVGQYEIKAVNGYPVNYDLGEITAGTLTVTPAPLTIKANDATRQYYSDEPNFGYTCNGFVNGENENVLSPKPTLATSANKYSSVGTYPIKASGASSGNYFISYEDGTLTIAPRTLYASVGNYERIYNEDNPEFEVKYDGFVENQDENVLIIKAIASTAATKTSDVGSYPINVTGGSADNYKFSYTSGTLTINKAEQTISWEQDLSNLKVGDQVELQAVASSGLPITYKMNSNDAAEIYSAGNNKTYLDCKAEGHFMIRASQEGNENYYSSTRVSKTATISGESSVRSLENTLAKIQKMPYGIRVLNAEHGELIRIYSTDGILQRSVRIESKITDIILSNGTIYVVKVGTRTMMIGL